MIQCKSLLNYYSGGVFLNRRSFLKFISGTTLGLLGAHLTIPYQTKAKMVTPVSGLIGNSFLNKKIKNNITKFKIKNPNMKLGETHCHSLHSDGHYSVEEIAFRAANVGLDFLLITEHLIPGQIPLRKTLESFYDRWQVTKVLNEQGLGHLKLYPAFELSTEQGHLILAMSEDWLHPKYQNDLINNFSVFDKKYHTAEQASLMIQSLGGVSIVPHPNIERKDYPFGIKVSFIQKHLLGAVNAIEDISTGHGYEENYSEQLNIASIGSSDDHFNFIIGSTVTGYDSTKHSDLISAIQENDTRAIKIDDSLDMVFSAARTIL